MTSEVLKRGHKELVKRFLSYISQQKAVAATAPFAIKSSSEIEKTSE